MHFEYSIKFWLKFNQPKLIEAKHAEHIKIMMPAVIFEVYYIKT